MKFKTKRTLVVQESIHVTFDKSNSLDQEKGISFHDVDSEILFEKITFQPAKQDPSKVVEVQEEHENQEQEDYEEITSLDM